MQGMSVTELEKADVREEVGFSFGQSITIILWGTNDNERKSREFQDYLSIVFGRWFKKSIFERKEAKLLAQKNNWASDTHRSTVQTMII